LVDAGGRLLAQSTAFDSPQEAGRIIAQLKQHGAAGVQSRLQMADGVAPDELEIALSSLAAE
jgi:tryptophanyl-tRNA synthetase